MQRSLARILAVAALVLTAVTAFAREPAKIYGLTIPERVGGLSHGEVIDYEAKSPGLGFALRFLDHPGWVVDVFFYDLGLTAIPSEIESEVVTRQVIQAKGDVFELGRRGTYADVRDLGDFSVSENGKTEFKCSTFSYQRGERRETNVDSFLCLTTWNGKFFKVRMTAAKGTLSRPEVTDFVKAWLPLLR